MLIVGLLGMVFKIFEVTTQKSTVVKKTNMELLSPPKLDEINTIIHFADKVFSDYVSLQKKSFENRRRLSSLSEIGYENINNGLLKDYHLRLSVNDDRFILQVTKNFENCKEGSKLVGIVNVHNINKEDQLKLSIPIECQVEYTPYLTFE
jgi:hypothetical protein